MRLVTQAQMNQPANNATSSNHSHIGNEGNDPQTQSIDEDKNSYRRIFMHRPGEYGPLIVPGSSIARRVMGNASSCSDIGNPGEIHASGARSHPNETSAGSREIRSNLSVSLEHPIRNLPYCKEGSPMHAEADSASGPPPMTSSSSPGSGIKLRRSMTPPAVIPSTFDQPVADPTIDIGIPPNRKVLRSMSSNEFRAIGPIKGSPYEFMLEQRDRLERSFSERLKQTREESVRSDSSQRSPLAMSDESSSLGSSRKARMANDARNRRRMEHTRAVTNDLCEIVTDMFAVESKLLKASSYGVVSELERDDGVDSKLEREHIWQSVKRFLSSLPPRYALGVETPSEVLVHMRLMAAVRSDPTKSVVHIAKPDDDLTASSGRSRRLVTIACPDAIGLLEFITKLLASGGSRVLDADVMLSSDNIVLDRFLVEMHGRLRLDKFSEYIEHFLENAENTQDNSKKSIVEGSSGVCGPSVTPQNREPSGTVYFSPPPDTPEVPTQQELQNEIKSAVPLSEVLESSGKLQPGMSGGPFQPLSRHLSLMTGKETPSLEAVFSKSNDNTSLDSVAHIALQKRVTASSKSEAGSMRRRRPLVNRRASSDLDRMESDDDDEVSIDVSAMVGANFGAMEKRNVPFIPFDELKLIETLGTGRVSTIYRAVWQRAVPGNGTAQAAIHMLALKVAMLNPETYDTSHVDELRREADIAARLSHPNVCELLGVASDSECFCLAYRYAEGGSLLSLLSDTARYYEYLPIALDVANGMAYLHSRNVIHRDLKPSNILLTRDHRAKISDFGMSVANTGQELTAETGTYRYMSPEVIRHEKYSSNADVYSFGLVLWQLITREVPFATLTPIQAAMAVAEGRRPTIPSSTPQRLQEIITACWDQDSRKRPSFTYITMALADYARVSFSPANVGAQTLQIANDFLANVEGNSTVNVDCTVNVDAPLLMGMPTTNQDDSFEHNIGLEI